MKLSGLERGKPRSIAGLVIRAAHQPHAGKQKVLCSYTGSIKRNYWPVLSCGGLWEGCSRNPRKLYPCKNIYHSQTREPRNCCGMKYWKAKNKHTSPTSWCLIWVCIWASHRNTELWFHSPYSTGHSCQWLRNLLGPGLEWRTSPGVQRAGFHSSL